MKDWNINRTHTPSEPLIPFDMKFLSLFDHLFNLVINFPFMYYIFGFMRDFGITVTKSGPIPKHVAFIMDGNRRFAKKKQMKLAKGHEEGAESLIKLLDTSFRLGIEHVTVYAFSIENFKRSSHEVDTLLTILRDRLRGLGELHKVYPLFLKISVRIIGNRSMIPKDILEDLEKIEADTAKATKVLNVCFPYTSRDEIAHAIEGIVAKPATDSITTKTIEEAMYFAADTPKLDLLIRTSGHQRLSDFMLWQCSTDCTIEFSNKLWPEYGYREFMSAVIRWGYERTNAMETFNRFGLLDGSMSKSVFDRK